MSLVQVQSDFFRHSEVQFCERGFSFIVFVALELSYDSGT